MDQPVSLQELWGNVSDAFSALWTTDISKVLLIGYLIGIEGLSILVPLRIFDRYVEWLLTKDPWGPAGHLILSGTIGFVVWAILFVPDSLVW